MKCFKVYISVLCFSLKGQNTISSTVVSVVLHKTLLQSQFWRIILFWSPLITKLLEHPRVLTKPKTSLEMRIIKIDLFCCHFYLGTLLMSLSYYYKYFSLTHIYIWKSEAGRFICCITVVTATNCTKLYRNCL